MIRPGTALGPSFRAGFSDFQEAGPGISESRQIFLQKNDFRTKDFPQGDDIKNVNEKMQHFIQNVASFL